MLVLRVIFPTSTKDLTPGNEIGVCFERGGKIASSQDVVVTSRSDGTVELRYEDTLSQVVTMYKDETDKFQEKIGNIVIRRKTKNMMGADTFKGLGLASFNLDAIANAYTPMELTLPISQCVVEGARVVIHVTPKFIGEVINLPIYVSSLKLWCNMKVDGVFDDTMSMHSGFSDGQIQAAEFESVGGDDILDPESVEVTTESKTTKVIWPCVYFKM